MAPPNPYFIYIELFKADGVTRPNQNEIARVRAYDVNSGATVWEGESGFNPSTGGWYPIYMQNFAAFYPPRDKPNLKFVVYNTQEQIVHTTQTFAAIPSASTVKIVIGVSDSLVGGGGSTIWTVSGTVKHVDTTPLAAGTVRAYDITSGSTKELGHTSIAAGGVYSISYTTADFTNNGSPHTPANLTVRAFSTADVLLGQAGPVSAAPNQILDITVPNEATPDPGSTKRRVFGRVQNQLGLPVSGIVVQAFHVGWTVQNLQEFPLQPESPLILSNGAGDYEIFYDVPDLSALAPCSPPDGQVNLIVYAKEQDGTNPLKVLFTSDIVFNAPVEQRVDLFVNKTAVSSDSEYQRIDTALTPCLGDGTSEAAKWTAINLLNQRPQYLTFVAQATGFDERLLRAYVLGWLIAGEINSKVSSPPLSKPVSPQVIFGLLRVLELTLLNELLNVKPEEFFAALVRAIHEGIIAATLEADLPVLLNDWLIVLKALMSASGSGFQADLLNLVFPDGTQFPQISAPTTTPFGSAVSGHAVAMPSGIQAGDLLIVVLATGGASGVTVNPPSSDWVPLFSAAGGTTTAVRLTAWAKKATSSEPATQTFTTVTGATPTNALAAAHTFRITKDSWKGDTASSVGLIGGGTQGTTGAINPGSLTIPTAWGTTPGKTLWIACGAHVGTGTLSTAPGSTPANYLTPVFRTPSGGSTGTCTVLSTTRENVVLAEDPGSFVLATAATWAAGTIAIREGILSAAPKREAIVAAYFKFQGSFSELVASLTPGTLSSTEAENLLFAFNLYEKVGRYFPIVKAVYRQKGTQWRTIQDLAKVPLNDGTAQCWFQYALDSLNYSQNTWPADVPGNTSQEKAMVYATRLFDLFQVEGAQQGFAADLGAAAGADTELQHIATFLRDTPAFDLDRTNVEQYFKEHPGGLTDAEIARLKQFQRVYRLTSDYDAIAKLISATPPLDSAVKIARIDEGDFIAAWEKDVGGLTAARDIHRTASRYASEVMFTLVKFHQNLNEVGGLTAVPGAMSLTELTTALDPTEPVLAEGDITQTGDPDSRKFPNWITLFGSLNQCACMQCQTALSPGAYLVDLLEFVEGAPKRTLFERRPDLEDIELTCTNTNTVLPYIDLVNETLEAVVAPLAGEFTVAGGVAAVLDAAAAENPDPAAMTALRAELQSRGYTLAERARVKVGAGDTASARQWVIEDDAWRFSIRQTSPVPFTIYPAPQTSANNDSLEVFPEHVNAAAYAKLDAAIFPFNLPLNLGREETQLFLKAKNVPHHQVLEAFNVDTGDQELEDPKIGLSYLELGASEAAAILGQVSLVRTLWGFDSDSPQITRPDQPTFKIQGNWVHLMSMVPVFQHRSGLRYQELLELLDTEFVHRFADLPPDSTTPHGLHLTAPSKALDECQSTEFVIAHLNGQVLQRISFFVRLWRKLGWSMRDLDRYLVELEANGIPEPDSVSGTLESRLLRLTHVRRLMDQLRLPPRVVIAFYKEMDRRRTQRHPRSLFDEVYLVGSPVQLEIQALEIIARGGTISDLGARPANEDLRGHVRAALHVKEGDIDLLWRRFVLATAPSTLDIAKLTTMYRYATLAAALKLTVSELFDLEKLTGDPLPSGYRPVLPAGVVADADLRGELLATQRALHRIRVARLTRMSAARMSYYLTAAHEDDDPFSVTDEALAKATRRLASAAAEIAAENPDQPNPDATVLGTALAKVMPADKVVRALAIITDADSGSSDQVTFVERYFSSFNTGTAVALLGQLATATSDTQAYGIVWDLLHRHLVDEARTTGAIAVAAELMGTSEDDANTLLTRALKRVSDASASAIADWKLALVGGWNTGEPTLENAGPGTREGTFIAAKSGEHRFIASVTPATAVVDISIEIDGETKILTAAAPVGGQIVFGPEPLRAGGAYKMKVTLSGAGSKFTLLVRVANDDAIVVPSTAVVFFDEGVYTKLFKAVGLVKGLELQKDELRHVVEDPSILDLNALPLVTSDAPVAWSSLQRLLELLELNRTTPLKAGTLFEFWRDVIPTLTPEEALSATAIQTGWKEDDLKVLRGDPSDASAPGLWAPDPAPDWDDPALWFVLQPCFKVIRRLDIKARQILALLVQNPPSIASAVLLRGIFRGQFSRDTWKEIMKPLRDPLRQRQRDALIGYLTTRDIALPGGGTGHFVDANDLFAHFMIDVEMEPDTLISRIKLALNVVQLFVHRVFLGLEDAESLGELAPKKDQWGWMEKFRVWEANRKVFLYPENWIEPDLRDDKSEFFTELEDELLQAPLTHETAMQALTSYLEKMSEVSNLEVVGSFAEGSPADGTNFTLHVVGRTRSRSRGIFYRRFHGKQDYDGYWTPWQRVNLEIEADVIMPVVVSGRLHLFWPKITTKERPKEHDVESPSDGKVAGDNPHAFKSTERIQYESEIRLMWSEFNPKKNKWGKPKLSKSRGVDPNAPTPFQRDIGDDQPRTENYHLRIHLESLHVAVDLYKTNVPTEPRTIIYDVREVQFLFWKFLLPATRVIETAMLDPKLLGTFRIWETGEDGFDRSSSSATLGQNYPIGTVLKSNAAVEVDFSVDNRVAADALQLGSNVAFLAKTPDFYRVHETNFNFVQGADKQPFFYETNLKSLFALNQPDVTVPALSLRAAQSVRFSTFNHPLVEVFQKELRYHGLEGLMHRLVQALPVADDRYYSSYYYDYYYGSLYLGYHIAGDYRALYTTQRIFESEHEPSAETVRSLYPLPTVEFGYGTSFGIYNWELFFHVPMLIAGRLSQDLKFDDALRWYHSVFDPKQELNKYEQTRSWVPELPPGCRYWNFLPFFSNRKAKDSLLDTLGLTTKLSEYDRNELTALIAEWRNTPFNPHLIARARVAAYQKFTVMKYLDNLIAWADSLFRQDTFETINEATQLYILADELLGKRPEAIDPLVAEPRLTYRELRAKGIDEFSNAIVEVESLIVSTQPYLKDTVQPALGSSMTTLKSLALKSFYFRIPRNERLDRYWDVVQDRLFKIRNSMNIDGVKRRLALFEPPIDPALLVRAAAAGLDLGSVLAALNAPLPCYRFSVWIQKATELANEVRSFGGAFLAALEKKDGEALSLLRQGHELKMLALVRKVREQQIKEAEENITGLELSRAVAEERRDFYRTRSKVSGGEQQQIGLTIASTVLEATQGALHGVAGMFGGVPDSIVGVVGPFPAGLAQIKIGSAGTTIATSAANVLGVAASVTRGLGTVAGLNAGYERRWEDWKLQERLANKEIEQLNQQIVVAKIRLDIAQKELANHEQQIEHAEEIQTFLEDKFTSRELYNWMVSELSRTYNQIYKLAYDAARTAERTFEFELGVTSAGFIQFGYVDSLRQGLLAGEKLILDLKRLDVAYLERHKRELEIQKPISLAMFDAQALQDLREKGSCTFELPEVLFDLDFPGQYFRRIKGVRLSIPCVTGPHTSVAAKLSLLGSAYRRESTADPAEYAYRGFEDARFVHDPIGITSIATGRAQADSGLFEFNFRDERYLPFEGAGAISRWRLELPTAFRQFDYNTISDVVMELNYTARDGGGLLKQGAEDSIEEGLNSIRELATNEPAAPTGLVRVFSLKREFPDVFQRLLTEGSGTATIKPEHFPFLLRHAKLGMTVVSEAGAPANPVKIHVVPKLGATVPAAKFKLNGGAEGSLSVTGGIGMTAVPKGGDKLLENWAPESWTLEQDGGLTTALTDDVVLIVSYTVAA